jgi:hypothetical protein
MDGIGDADAPNARKTKTVMLPSDGWAQVAQLKPYSACNKLEEIDPRESLPDASTVPAVTTSAKAITKTAMAILEKLVIFSFPLFDF